MSNKPDLICATCAVLLDYLYDEDRWVDNNYNVRSCCVCGNVHDKVDHANKYDVPEHMRKYKESVDVLERELLGDTPSDGFIVNNWGIETNDEGLILCPECGGATSYFYPDVDGEVRCPLHGYQRVCTEFEVRDILHRISNSITNCSECGGNLDEVHKDCKECGICYCVDCIDSMTQHE